MFTLFAAWLLDQLGLPDDLLRNVAIVLLFVVAATLLIPRGRPADRTAARGLLALPARRRRRRVLPRRVARARVRAVRGPGPRHHQRGRGQQLGRAARDPADTRLRGRSRPADAPDRPRRAGSSQAACAGTPRRCGWSRASLIAAVAIALVFHLDDNLATLTPGYTAFLQTKLEDNSTAKRELSKVRGGGQALAAVRKTPQGRPARLRRRAAAPRRRRLDQLASR